VAGAGWRAVRSATTDAQSSPAPRR
jgi:hypothetical protein